MPLPALRSWNVGLAVAAAAALITEGALHTRGGLPAGAYVLALAAAIPPAGDAESPATRR